MALRKLPATVTLSNYPYHELFFSRYSLPLPCGECYGIIEEWKAGETVIHHRNGDHSDDTLANLQLLHHACHTKVHARARQPMSEATKQKLRAKRKFYTVTQLTRLKQSIALKGHPVSDETRRKISEALKGRSHSEATKRKISQTLKGRKPSAETIEKLRLANTGRKNSDEAKQRMSEASKKRKRVTCECGMETSTSAITSHLRKTGHQLVSQEPPQEG